MVLGGIPEVPVIEGDRHLKPGIKDPALAVAQQATTIMEPAGQFRFSQDADRWIALQDGTLPMSTWKTWLVIVFLAAGASSDRLRAQAPAEDPR